MTMDESKSGGGLLRQFVTGVAIFGMVAGVSVAGAQSDSTEGAASQPEQTDSRTVLVTGANRGLGLEFARQYKETGWTVIATARNPESATDLNALGVRVMQLDVTDPKSVAALAVDLNGASIDLLINNAGIFPRSGSLAETDFEDVARTYEVNTIGPMRVTRALLPNLRSGEMKTVVSITSGLGSIADNTGGRFYGYRESKAALNMFTRSLAAELRDEGFTCVVISPGWVQTDMGGPNANLTPEESIAGMRVVIANLTPANTGAYWNYDGETISW
jgi:NAD(P)-dependent dehydrogenase (short-subunit alcohol dehydrogenase family)